MAGQENQWIRDSKSTVSMHVPEGFCAVFQDNVSKGVEVLDSTTFGPVSKEGAYEPS
jgi:hypothetical protein